MGSGNKEQTYKLSLDIVYEQQEYDVIVVIFNKILMATQTTTVVVFYGAVVKYVWQKTDKNKAK